MRRLLKTRIFGHFEECEARRLLTVSGAELASFNNCMDAIDTNTSGLTGKEKEIKEIEIAADQLVCLVALNNDAVDDNDIPGVIIGASDVVGDANQDGKFDSTDFVAVFQAGKYESSHAAVFEEGDWNGDQVFDSSDLVLAFAKGNYAR